MRIRFQADADLNQIIVRATLRLEPAIDFQTATAAALSGLADKWVQSGRGAWGCMAESKRPFTQTRLTAITVFHLTANLAQ